MYLRLHFFLMLLNQLLMGHYFPDFAFQNLFILLILLFLLCFLLPLLLLLRMLLLLLLTIAVGQPLQKIHALRVTKRQIVSSLLCDLVHL